MSAIPAQQQIIPEVITYPNVSLDVQTDPTGNLILFADVIGPAGIVRRMMFPMGAAYAETLGKKLTAPRVQVATPGMVNGNGKPH